MISIRQKSILLLTFIFSACVLSGLLVTRDTYASDRSLNHGYFHNKQFTDTGNKVLRDTHKNSNGTWLDGVPSSVNSKQDFITFIEKLYNDHNTSKDAYADHNNYIGAAYIIQTMRGSYPSGSWDHNLPSSADIKDWEIRINDSDIGIDWHILYSGYVNTKTIPVDGGITNDVRDTLEYRGSKNSQGEYIKYDSIRFYRKSTGKNLYVIKWACGNPLGGLDGVPTITPTNYILGPIVSLNTASVEVGSPFTVTSTMNNTGTTKSDNISWQLTKKILAPGVAVPSGGNSSRDPCDFLGATDCSVSDSGSNTVFGIGSPAVGTPTIPVHNENAQDLSAGSRICFILSVQPRANVNGAVDSNWAHSTPKCLLIGVRPKVQIWGGDLMVGGSVTTSGSVKNIGGVDRTFGSWAEYGILATGIIKGMASGSAFAGPGLANPTVCKYSTLSFTNAGSSTSCEANQSAGAVIGGYVSTRSLPDVAASFPIISTTPNVAANLSGLPSGTYTASGNVSLSGGNIEKSQYIVINAPSATITITGNINYTNGTLQKLSDIPQVVIIANKIVINSDVINVDAWLIAKNSSNTGEIYTCEILGDTINKCNKPLVVNGPVMTNKLYLRRTGGSGAGTASGDPAEVFNLRPDAYLWAFSRAATNGRIRTVYTTELPPRL